MTAAGETRFAKAADGAVLQYEVAGDGEPIVFLHGGFASRAAFVRQRDALGDEFRVILRDLRGHGGSTCAIPADYGIDTTEVSDLLTVLDAEGIERAHLVGHSTGGAIAFCLGLAHPERTGRLVLLEPSLISLLPPDVYETGWRPLTEALARARTESPPGAGLGDVLKLLLGDGWETQVRPSVLARMEAILDISMAQVRALDRLTITDAELRMLRVPTLLLYGEHSLPVEPFIAERLRQVRPDLQQMLIEKTTHNMHLDQPEQVNRAIRDFLHG
jgi:pimeloyl-ACP methyl ester carboxylesterase